MARQPAAARAAQEAFEQDDPVDEVLRGERNTTANDLAEALESFRGVDQGNVKGILYRIRPGGGKYEWIKEVYAPFDHNEIFTDLQKRFGGGDFQLRMMVNGRIATNINFSIVNDPLFGQVPPKAENSNNDLTMMMFQMMMRQSEDAARQRADDMRDRQAASERQTAMIVGLATAAIPILAGGKDKMSEVMLALAPFINKKEEDGTEKTLTLLRNVKELFDGGASKPGDDMQDLVSNGVKLIGPAMKGLGDMMRGRGTAPPAGASMEGGEGGEPPALMLRAPEAGPDPRADQARPPAGTGQFPALDVIRADVLYFYARGHDPEKAADMIYDIVEENGVSEDDINALFLAISPDPLAGLAAEGIDLRGRPQWANDFLQALFVIHTGGGDEPGEDAPENAHDHVAADAGRRGDGGAADPATDGKARPQRAAKPDGAK